MNNRERMRAIMHYEAYDRMPIVSFGFWNETLEKWAEEGHITQEEAEGYARYGDNSPADRQLMKNLGFDFNWNATASGATFLRPGFPEEILEKKPDGYLLKSMPKEALMDSLDRLFRDLVIKNNTLK